MTVAGKSSEQRSFRKNIKHATAPLCFGIYQLNATRLNTTLNLTSLGSLLNEFGIQVIRVYMKLECHTPEYHIVNYMHAVTILELCCVKFSNV